VLWGPGKETIGALIIKITHLTQL